MCKTEIKIDSSDIKELANKLFDKICYGFSWLARRETPQSIAIRNYIEDIEKNESLNPQTKAILIYNAKRDIERWSNQAAICIKAKRQLMALATEETGSTSENLSSEATDSINEDWINLFAEKAANISSEEMQEIWAMLLSQEYKNPGSIPKALLQTMEIMEKIDAEAFMTLSSFCLKIDDERLPLVISHYINDYYSKHGLDLETLNRLETLGLINMDLNTLGGIALMLENNDILEYFGQSLKVSEVREVRNNQGNQDNQDNQNNKATNESTHRNIPFGCVTLSYIGEALMKIAELHGINKVNGFFDEIVIPYFKGTSK